MKHLVPTIEPYEPPTQPTIAIVGDAPSQEDLKWSRPFRDYKGAELQSMLVDAGIEFMNCFQTTVIIERPPLGDISKLCHKKRDVLRMAQELGWKDYPFQPIRAGEYLSPWYTLDLFRLQSDLARLRPNVVITLGGFATWALTGNGAITKSRGTVVESTLVPGLKVLPTFHPGAVISDWSKRVVVLQDLLKAKRESEYPEIRRPRRLLAIAETINDIWDFKENHLDNAALIACDIETNKNRFISCISFAPSPDKCLCVPFISYNGRRHSHYWPTVQDELLAWETVNMILTSSVPKLWQNGLYDLQYLYTCGIHPKYNIHDTMLSHHSIWPELPKSLGFMGSIFCNESAWKELRPRGKEASGKKDS